MPLQKGFDVFNALDLMENKTFLEKLKFGIGDGNLQYYLYNWKCPSMAPEKVRALWGPASMRDPIHREMNRLLVLGTATSPCRDPWDPAHGLPHPCRTSTRVCPHTHLLPGQLLSAAKLRSVT